MLPAPFLSYNNLTKNRMAHISIVKSPHMPKDKALLFDKNMLNYYMSRNDPVQFMKEYSCDWVDAEPPETTQDDMAINEIDAGRGLNYRIENSVSTGIGSQAPTFQLKTNLYRSPEEIKEMIIKELSEFWLVHLILSIDPDDFIKRRTEEITAENTVDKPPVYDSVDALKINFDNGSIYAKEAFIRDWIIKENLLQSTKHNNYLIPAITGTV